jgi:hypothetical protein
MITFQLQRLEAIQQHMKMFMILTEKYEIFELLLRYLTEENHGNFRLVN